MIGLEEHRILEGHKHLEEHIVLEERHREKAYFPFVLLALEASLIAALLMVGGRRKCFVNITVLLDFEIGQLGEKLLLALFVLEIGLFLFAVEKNLFAGGNQLCPAGKAPFAAFFLFRRIHPFCLFPE